MSRLNNDSFGLTIPIIDAIPNKTKTCAARLGRIAIVVLADARARDDFRPAIRSLSCYAQKQNYTFITIDPQLFPNEYSTAQDECKRFQRDLMFWRHCIVLQILPLFDWILAIDGDVGIFNANKCLEDLVSDNQNLIQEERFHNGEIQAGSYMIKNSVFGLEYLKKWIQYFDKMPNVGFSNSDNGALHIHLLHYYTQDTAKLDECLNLWHRSNDLSQYDQYVGCCIKYISSSNNKNIRIIRRGHGFMRDLWVTNNAISLEVDFFLHAIKGHVMMFDSSQESNDRCGTSEYEPIFLIKNETHNEKGISILNQNDMKKIIHNADIQESSKRPHSYIPTVFVRDCWPECPEFH